MEALKDVMLHLIADRGPLPPERKDHTLEGGKWKGDRECHISGDFLLIYRYVPAKNPTKILFVRTGTHPQLFGR
jgi:mRNA interferase YafQ